MPTSNANPAQGELSQAAACLSNGDTESALTHLKTALAAEPENELVLGMLASVYAQLGMDERATEFFEKILAVNPANPLARFQLGLLVFQRGQPEQALAIWQASEPPQGDFMIRFYSGLALAQLGRSEEARTLFLAAREHVPSDHPVRAEVDKLLSN